MIPLHLYSKTYDEQNYNCAHLTVDVWKAETGEDISSSLIGMMKSKNDRKVDPAIRRNFTRLQKAESPCLVLMRNGREDTHAGVYLRGKIVQIGGEGVTCTSPDIATRPYRSVRFYR